MIFRCFALIALLCFVDGSVSAAVSEFLYASAGAHPMSHSESSSCPDPGDDGNPCGPTCPCACCPGHLAAATFVSVRPSIQAPPSDEFQLSLLNDLHPKDVIFRIFHPPRV
jgi:hypothetical protein